MFVLAGVMNPQSAPVPTDPVFAPSPTVIAETPIPGYQPVFQEMPCRFQKPDKVQVTCGFLTVPEDRGGDLTDTIRIAVAVFHSTGATPKPDPILYLQGGPGDNAIDWSVSTFSHVVAPFLDQRDFIVFDPRGVGYSDPNLACDEFTRTYLQDLQGRIPADQRASYYEGALLGCKNSLLKLGANLSAYTSIETAADAKDILVALGYQQANLYGISYGTRVAQLIMRDYPQFIRSAVLDSVVPVEAKLLSRSADEQDIALKLLFEDCKADPECATAYPDLESVYDEVVERLNAQPIQLTFSIDENRKFQQSIDGSAFHDAILWSLRTPQMIALAPSLIYRSHDGDNSMLMLSLVYPVLAFDSISMGAYISVNCHDQVFAMSTEKLDSTLYGMCKEWDTDPLAPGETDPVISNIPTLLFAGRYDSVTPLSFAQQVAAHLTNGFIVEIPDQGHAPSSTGVSDCPTKIMTAFLQDPSISPDQTCAHENKAVKFIVPYDANEPLVLEPTVITQYEINTVIPSGWREASFGFYNRGTWFGDLTQIGVQKAAISPDDWAKWLSINFQGGRGFDRPAVQYDRQKANGLTWSIYKTTSKGNPVEIAFANSSNETLMVLLISYPNEHDALYKTVFLPVVDSTRSSK
jgi:pimeloyl-ACP methyl ester carboxylesterase